LFYFLRKISQIGKTTLGLMQKFLLYVPMRIRGRGNRTLKVVLPSSKIFRTKKLNCLTIIQQQKVFILELTLNSESFYKKFRRLSFFFAA